MTLHSKKQPLNTHDNTFKEQTHSANTKYTHLKVSLIEILVCLIVFSISLSLSEVSSWIVCDGDIDPEWIESLNSVLDDNRLLTMPSGERIQFGPNVNFLFETHDLSCASPATISRMGMIFLR